MTTKRRTADEYEREQRQEWTTWVATVAIDYYGTRAYNPGDPVPASAVGDDPAAGRWVSPEWVSKRADPFEGSGTVVPPEAPTINPTTVAAPPGAAVTDTTVTSTEG